MRSIFLFLVLLQLTVKSLPPRYSIENNDRILFIGDSSTVQGSARDNGFVNVFENEIKKNFSDVQIFNAGLNLATNEDIRNKINEGALIEHFKPTKVIMVAGTDQFIEGPETDLSKIRYPGSDVFTLE